VLRWERRTTPPGRLTVTVEKYRQDPSFDIDMLDTTVSVASTFTLAAKGVETVVVFYDRAGRVIGGVSGTAGVVPGRGRARLKLQGPSLSPGAVARAVGFATVTQP
jgi:hypothetical protein